MKKYNYENKNVYIGLDVHKKTYALTARCEELTVKKVTLAADPKVLVTFLKKHFLGANVFSAYEAGFCGFYLHRYLSERGIKNIVVNPASIETAARERVKNDKRDSLKIAVQLEAKRLKGIHIPSVQQERERELSRYREVLIKKKKRVSNQIKSFFARHGIPFKASVVSKKWIADHKDIELPSELRFVLDGYIAQWLYFFEQIQEVEKQLFEQGKKNSETHEIIQSMTGVGLVTARFLANELGDMSQFHNVRQLYSFTGLTPREYSSGDHIRLGHISRQGRGALRKTLVQSAWVAIRCDQEIRLQYDYLSQRIGKKKAVIAIARKLIGKIRACLKRGSNYIRYQVTKQGELIPCRSY